jgi:hypothetical protein
MTQITLSGLLLRSIRDSQQPEDGFFKSTFVLLRSNIWLALEQSIKSKRYPLGWVGGRREFF